MSSIEPNAQALLLLTARLDLDAWQANGHGTKPLTITKWRKVQRWLEQHRLQPADLLVTNGDVLRTHDARSASLPVEDIKRLISRGVQVAMRSEKWYRVGLWVMTYLDHDYPEVLRERLPRNYPPIFFGCGDRSLVSGGGLTVVGSRNAPDRNLKFAYNLGRAAAREETTVVSGGARGVDAQAMRGALEAEGNVIGVLSHNLERRSTDPSARRALMDGRLVILSVTSPDVKLDRWEFIRVAMQRNDYIYCLSDAAVVAHYDHIRMKGGTWSGAIKNLKYGWVPLWVRRSTPRHPGSDPLISAGARDLPAEEMAQEQLNRILPHIRQTRLGRIPASSRHASTAVPAAKSLSEAPPKVLEPSHTAQNRTYSKEPPIESEAPLARVSGAPSDLTEEVILLLTTDLESGDITDDTTQPLSPQEWAECDQWLQNQQLEPERLLSDSLDHILPETGAIGGLIARERIRALLNPDRRRRLCRRVAKWHKSGLWFVHCRERDYPKSLKESFKQSYPTVLFGVGNRELLGQLTQVVTVAGYDKNYCKSDLEYAKNLGRELAKKDITVMTQGESDLGSEAVNGALKNDGRAIVIKACGLLSAARCRNFQKAPPTERLVILSEIAPEMEPAKKSSEEYRRHNALVYGCSVAGVIVNSGLGNNYVKKGALQCLKEELSCLWVYRTREHRTGNRKVVEKGGTWLPDGEDAASHVQRILSGTSQKKQQGELF